MGAEYGIDFDQLSGIISANSSTSGSMQGTGSQIQGHTADLLVANRSTSGKLLSGTLDNWSGSYTQANGALDRLVSRSVALRTAGGNTDDETTQLANNNASRGQSYSGTLGAI